MKILITGVYGIVGSHLCKELKKNHEIVGIGRRDQYLECDKYYSCDITNKDELKKVIEENKDLDIIIHCAALAHNKGNDLSKERFMKVNFEATKYLIDLSNEFLNLKNFIFISTISVYGEKLEKSLYTEEDECTPKSPYAIAKKMSEEYIQNKYSRNYTVLRLAPVYSNNFKLNIERRSLIKDIPYRVGNGKQKLSLCNIKNIYEAIEYIVNNSYIEKKEIYNISDERICEFNDLLEVMRVKNKVILPKVCLVMVNKINYVLIKNQFINENTIKLISDNIYDSSKISNKVRMKFNIKDVM